MYAEIFPNPKGRGRNGSHAVLVDREVPRVLLDPVHSGVLVSAQEESVSCMLVTETKRMVHDQSSVQAGQDR